MWFYIEIAAYVSLLIGYGLLLLLAVRHRIEHGRAQRLLEATIALTAAWTLALALMILSPTDHWWTFLWQRVAQVGMVGMALLVAELANAYVQRRSRLWLRLLVVGPLVVAAILLDALPLYYPALEVPVLALRIGISDFATLFLVIAWFLSTILAWWTSIAALHRATSIKHQNRIRYLFISLFVLTMGDLVIWINDVHDLYVGLGTHLLGLSIITFAILRYDLPDIRRLALIWLRLALLAVLTMLLYFATMLIFGWLSGILPNPTRLTTVIPALLLALLVAALLDVLISPRLYRLFDRAFLGQYYDVQTALRTYSQQISLILDLERLADVTLEWLNNTMRVERSAFILFTPHDDEQVELKALRATFDTSSPAKLFDTDNRFIVHFHRFRRPLTQYDLDMLSWFQAMPEDTKQWLRRLTVDLYVPVLVADQPIALLALGPKAGGQPYSDEDLETLIILASQTGTALENARLLGDLRSVQDDLQQLTAELSETNRQLKRLDKTKADFIAIASHELRTPLTQIYGYSDVLSNLANDKLGNAGELHTFIEGISRGATRLKRVVDAMVDVSLIETGGMLLHRVTLPLGVIVQNAVETVQPGARERNVTFSVKDMSALPYIQADSARMEQVLVGLLSNAVKFSPDDSEIVVSARLDEPYVEILVTDPGIGIDADQQDLIFDKFYRGESSMLHSTDEVRFKGGGPGLGLAIAKGLVEAHGGRLWVESPGRDEETFPGSTFHVRIPISVPAKETEHGQPSS